MPRFDVQSIPAIWVRELTLFKRYWRGTTFSAILEPLIFLFGIGLGVGAFLDEIDGVKYVIFVGTGAVATAVIFSSVFPGMYNTFIARTFQKVYDGILATPTTAAEIMVAEALWIATRTAVYGSVPIVVTIPFRAQTDVNDVARAVHLLSDCTRLHLSWPVDFWRRQGD